MIMRDPSAFVGFNSRIKLYYVPLSASFYLILIDYIKIKLLRLKIKNIVKKETIIFLL